MSSLTPDIVDLRSELLFLKKKFGDSKSENTILKVKIRRMQEELLRKNKELQFLLDPQKVINRRIVAEQGTSLIIKLKEQVEDLKMQLHMRDFQIKKLQNQLLATRVYDKSACFPKGVSDDVQSGSHSNGNTKNTRNYNNLDIYLNKPGDGCREPCSPSPISEFSHAIDNLQKNITKIKRNSEGQENGPCTYNMENTLSSCSPDVNMEKSGQAAHQELEDLTSYVMQMTLELENLKTNFMQLQRKKCNRSKSAEPKLGAKSYSPKLILVQPKETTDIQTRNCAPLNEASINKANQINGKFAVKTAFDEKSKNRPRPKKREVCQKNSDYGVCKYIDEADSVSEIIFLKK